MSLFINNNINYHCNSTDIFDDIHTDIYKKLSNSEKAKLIRIIMGDNSLVYNIKLNYDNIESRVNIILAEKSLLLDSDINWDCKSSASLFFYFGDKPVIKLW